jgi:hypothetical protein
MGKHEFDAFKPVFYFSRRLCARRFGIRQDTGSDYAFQHIPASDWFIL